MSHVTSTLRKGEKMNTHNLRRILEEAYEEVIGLRKYAESLGREDIAEMISDALADIGTGEQRIEQACKLANSR
jgi:hypothetical protein